MYGTLDNKIILSSRDILNLNQNFPFPSLLKLHNILNAIMTMYFYNALLCLADYFMAVFQSNTLLKQYTLMYFIGAFMSFFAYNWICRLLSYNKRIIAGSIFFLIFYCSIWILSRNFNQLESEIEIFCGLFLQIGLVHIHIENSFTLNASKLGKSYLQIYLVGLAIGGIFPNVLIFITIYAYGWENYQQRTDVCTFVGVVFFGIWFLYNGVIIYLKARWFRNNILARLDCSYFKFNELSESENELKLYFGVKQHEAISEREVSDEISYSSSPVQKFQSVFNYQNLWEKSKYSETVESDFEDKNYPVNYHLKNFNVTKDVLYGKNETFLDYKFPHELIIEISKKQDKLKLDLKKLSACTQSSISHTIHDTQRSTNSILSNFTQTDNDLIDWSNINKSISQSLYLIIGNFMIFFCTLGIFPSQVFKLGYYIDHKSFYSPLVFAYALGDILGRKLGVYCMPKYKQFIKLYYTLRTLFFYSVYSLLLSMKSDGKLNVNFVTYINVFLTLALGFTNGQGMAMMFGKSQEEKNFEVRKATDFLLLLMMFLGLVAGSSIALLF